MNSGDNVAVRLTNRLATALAAVAGIVLVGLMVVTFVDVAARYFLNRPLGGVFDLSQLGVVIITFFSLAYCETQRAHVSIEVLFNPLSRPVKRIVTRITNLAGASLMFTIGWQSFIASFDSMELNESSNLLLIPFYPFFWVVAFGSFIFGLVMLLRVLYPAPEAAPDT